MSPNQLGSADGQLLLPFRKNITEPLVLICKDPKSLVELLKIRAINNDTVLGNIALGKLDGFEHAIVRL